MWPLGSVGREVSALSRQEKPARSLGSATVNFVARCSKIQNRSISLAEAFLHHAGGAELRRGTLKDPYPAALFIRFHSRRVYRHAHDYRNGGIVCPHAAQDTAL